MPDTTLNINIKEHLMKVALGLIDGESIVQKFGAGTLTTTMAPITNSTIYKTPTAAVDLEVVSTSSQDGVAGSGALTLTIVGTDAAGNELSQEVIMNGQTPVAIPISLLRLYRWSVKESGSYADQSTGSQVGTLTIQEAGGGDKWSDILPTPFPAGQSQIGVYTVPKGFTAYLLSKDFFVDSNKSANIYFFKRTNILNVSAPFDPMRLIEREVGVKAGYGIKPVAPKLLGVGPMDVGFMGVMATGTGDCSVEFEMWLIAD